MTLVELIEKLKHFHDKEGDIRVLRADGILKEGKHAGKKVIAEIEKEDINIKNDSKRKSILVIG